MGFAVSSAEHLGHAGNLHRLIVILLVGHWPQRTKDITGKMVTRDSTLTRWGRGASGGTQAATGAGIARPSNQLEPPLAAPPPSTTTTRPKIGGGPGATAAGLPGNLNDPGGQCPAAMGPGPLHAASPPCQ